MCGVATILVLDNDPAMTELMRTLLEDQGHTAIIATSLDRVPVDARPDLVLSDLMPLKGYRPDQARAWVASVRARFDSPVIVVTGHAGAAAEQDKLGAEAVITKPFDLDQLIALVSGHLR
jgi:DNA-binding response OmpR family regulator